MVSYRPGGRASRGDLLGDDRVGVRAAPGEVLLEVGARCEVLRHLEAVHDAAARAGVHELVVGRRGLERAARRQLLVRVRDEEAACIELRSGLRAGRQSSVANGPNRAMSMPKTSSPGSPSTIQLASASPMPAPCEKPAMTPQAAQKLRRPGTGPTSGLPSGVKVMPPLTHRLMPTFCRAGNRSKPIESSGAIRSISSGISSMP